ncbi:MAG: dTDP-4-dehydrorhamnose reductase [Frankiales bacterium]|nr:dTDP-4-dehydrorhamnose reductase [Frankiales bacterium]
MALALLITGCKGQLGTDLMRKAHAAPDIAFARGIDLPEVDLTDPFATRDTVQEWARVVRSDNPDHKLVVLNPAAYTAVDKAEEQEELAYAVNATAPALLATACQEVGAGLVHVSTDYVFPGDGTSPYEPDDPKGPTNAYGRTKLAGELAIAEILPDAHWIVRTAWLYGAGGPNIVKTVCRLERERDTCSFIADQVGSPTWAGHLSARLLDIARADVAPGSYHGTNRGQTSWFGFAQAIFEELGADPSRVSPTDSASFVTPATRPAYSVMSGEKWDAAGLPPFPDWRDALREAFEVEGDALRGA